MGLISAQCPHSAGQMPGRAQGELVRGTEPLLCLQTSRPVRGNAASDRGAQHSWWHLILRGFTSSGYLTHIPLPKRAPHEGVWKGLVLNPQWP